MLDELRTMGTPGSFSFLVLFIRLLYLCLLIGAPIGAFALVILSLMRLERSWNRSMAKLAKRPILSTVLFILIACYGFAAPMGLPALATLTVYKVFTPIFIYLPPWAGDVWTSQCG